MVSKPFLLTGLAVGVLAASLAAQAQSPFAKRGKQAWEQAQPESQPQPQPVFPSTPQTTYPASAPYTGTPYTSTTPTNAPTTSNPYATGGSSTPAVPAYSAPYNSPQRTYHASPNGSTSVTASTSVPTLAGGAPQRATGAYYPPQGASNNVQYQNANQGYTNQEYIEPKPVSRAGVYQGPTYGNPSQRSMAPYGGTSAPGVPQQQNWPTKLSWKERLGWNNIVHKFSGYLKGGVAGTYTDDDFDGEDSWRADYIGDGALRGELGAVTPSGLEYGLGLEARAQYDKYRRGFGGLVGDCEPSLPGCLGVDVDGTDFALRGHTSRFYASGPSDAKEGEAQLEGAYLYLRSAYGDLTLGRDDGSAYLFSLGAPTLLAVGASNNSVDYTGLDAVKTLNDASGFAEKITYTSPRLLGDAIGVGVQFGASYAADAEACGVDYCVRGANDEPEGVLAADLQNVLELGVSLDRSFANGFSVEGTATYSTAENQRDIAGFDDLKVLGLGLGMDYNGWSFGASYLNSNNALSNGDYTAWDTGLTWQPGQWGFTAGYGQSSDDNVGLESRQAVLGMNYDFSEHYRLGTGVQYIDRDVRLNTGGVLSERNEKATALFVEGRVTF